MRNRFIALLALLLAAGALFALDDITGIWKQIDEKTNKPETLVYIYSYQGKLFGRMLVSYNSDGSVNDTIYIRKDVADKLMGAPPFCGLDYVYNLVAKGNEYKGGIMDPRTAEEYDCRVWKDGSKLIVRGQLKGLGFFLGRNQTWLAACAEDLPPGFQVPDPSTFVPVVPKKK